MNKIIYLFIFSEFFHLIVLSSSVTREEVSCDLSYIEETLLDRKFEKKSLVSHDLLKETEKWKTEAVIELEKNDIIEGNDYEYVLQERIRFSTIYPLLGHSGSTQKALTKFKHSFDVALSSLSQKSVKLLSLPEETPEKLGFSRVRLGSSEKLSEKYSIGQNFARGNFGEVWYARGRVKAGVRLLDDYLFEDFVLKRIFCERGEALFESGRREVYFGKKLSGKAHVSRFIESFSLNHDLWLVFRNEGKSLDKVLYEEVLDEDRVFYQPSQFWYSLRNSEYGLSIRVELLRQVIEGLEVISESEIVHRDLKPSNLFLQTERDKFMVRLGDFGSAFDYEVDLYETRAASYREETERYAPPESRLFRDKVFPYVEDTESSSESLKYSFDIWSAAVVYLELFLGTERVFEIEEEKTRKKIEKQLIIRATKQGVEVTDELRTQAQFIQGLAELGISPYSFNKTQFSLKVRQKDSFSVGLTGLESQVLFKMLQWKPENRLSASELLTMPLFI